MWTTDDALYNEYAKEGLQLGAKHMTELKQLLDTQQIPLTVVVYPWPDQIINNDLTSKQVRHWQQWSQQQQVKFINLFPAFMDSGEPIENIKTNFIAGDVHWSEKGHALVVNNILEALATHQ